MERRQMARVMRKLPFSQTTLTIFLLSVILAASSCSKGQGSAQRPQPVPVPVVTAPVVRGDISSTISYSGTVEAVAMVELVPEVTARVEDILVDAGDIVEEGQILAQLESASLEASVRQAEANFRKAQADLSKRLEGARPEEVAVAKAQLEAQRERLGQMTSTSGGAVAVAEAALASAQSHLADMKSQPKATDLQKAQASVDSAQASLNDAEAKHFRLLNPTQEDIETQLAAVQAAKAALDSAEAKLADLESEPKPVELKQAETAVARARADLELAKGNLELLKLPLREEKVDDIIQARIRLFRARQKLLEDQANGASQEQLDKDNEEVIQALLQVEAAEKELDWPDLGVRAEDFIVAQLRVESAQAAVTEAQAELDEAKAGPTAAELGAARSAVEQTRSAWVTSRTRLTELRTPSSTAIQTSQSAVERAKASLVSAQAELQKLRDGPTDAVFQEAEESIVRAQSQIELARRDISVQQQQVVQTQSNFTLTENPFTPNDLASTTAQVAASQAALDLARIQLSKATIRSPFPAVVQKRHLSRGAMASSQRTIFSLVSRRTEVVFNSDEAAVGMLTRELPARILVPAYPEIPFTGRISSVAPTADPASRTFSIKLGVEDPENRLLTGMSATVTVAIQSKSATLIVPKDALVKRGATSVAFVVIDEKVQMRQLSLGISDADKVEIVKGLTEGEVVVTRGNKTIKDGDPVRIQKR